MSGIDSDLIRGHIDTIILNILKEGDKYGYEICNEVEERSKGAYELKQPTLYSCLKRLEGQGLISSYWEDSDIGGRRHYYKLTDLGKETYDKNQEDWRRSRVIIDSLINNGEQPSEPVDLSPVESEDHQPEAQEEKTYPIEDYDFSNDEKPNLFEQLDEEVKEQDEGNELDNNALLSPKDEAQANGYDSVDNQELPFDESFDGSCYAGQNSAEEDDILSLLGHYSNEQEKTGDDALNDATDEDDLASADDSEEENQEPEVKTQESEIMEKFLTGKYSEYNPDKIATLEDNTIDEFIIEDEPESEPKTEEPEVVYDDSVFEDSDSNSELAYFSNSADQPQQTFEKNNEPSPALDNYQNDETNNEIRSDGFDYTNLFAGASDENENDSEETEQEQPTIEQEESENPYSNITYFNNNEDDVYSTQSAINSFSDKFGYDSSEFNVNQDDNADDEIVMDFSQKQDAIEDNAQELIEDVEPANEIESAPEVKEVSYDNADNPLDLTSVYDSGSNVDATYTDSQTKEKLNEIAASLNEDAFNDDGTKKELTVDKTITGIVVDKTQPKDLSVLKSNFNEEGINVKPYYKSAQTPQSSKSFIETNKIKMVRNWIVFFIELVLLGVTFVICNAKNISPLTFKDTFSYYLIAGLFLLVLAMYSQIRFWINPYKKIPARYAPRISILFSILFTVQFLVVIYCINLIIGFDGFNQIDYNHLNWIIPSIVALFPILQSITYTILYKSRNFHI